MLDEKERRVAQKLINICFSIGLVISDDRNGMINKTNEEKAEWIAEELRGCGFDTHPCGASWGVLNRQSKEEFNKAILRGTGMYYENGELKEELRD